MPRFFIDVTSVSLTTFDAEGCDYPCFADAQRAAQIALIDLLRSDLRQGEGGLIATIRNERFIVASEVLSMRTARFACCGGST